MIVFSGSSNKPLAEKLAKKLKVTLGMVELSRFENGEIRVFIKEKVSDDVAVVVQSLSTPPDEHLVEFVLICDALKRMGVGKIIGVVPWLGYSKQDKVFRPGEPLSVKVIAQMLQVVPLTRLITFDLHNPAILGFFEIPVSNLSARQLFSQHIKPIKGSEPLGGMVVVAPDAGAVKASTQFALELGVQVAYIDKVRDLTTGRVTIQGINGDISGKQVLMIDDMIVTGSTLIETSKYLKKVGVKKIVVAATHHLYLPGVDEKLSTSSLDRLIITDTIQKPRKALQTRTTILSIADLLAKELSSL